MRAILLLGLIALFSLIGSVAEAQRYMMNGGYGGWGTYRYWGPWGRPGGYYNGGDYRWNGFRPWRYRNYY